MPTYTELMAQAEELKRQADEIRKQEQTAGVAEIRRIMAEHGLTSGDLGFPQATATAKPRAVGGQAKYRDPASGLTWTGKGRVPAWAIAHKAAGRDLAELAIQ